LFCFVFSFCTNIERRHEASTFPGIFLCGRSSFLKTKRQQTKQLVGRPTCPTGPPIPSNRFEMGRTGKSRAAKGGRMWESPEEIKLTKYLSIHCVLRKLLVLKSSSFNHNKDLTANLLFSYG